MWRPALFTDTHACRLGEDNAHLLRTESRASAAARATAARGLGCVGPAQCHSLLSTEPEGRG